MVQSMGPPWAGGGAGEGVHPDQVRHDTVHGKAVALWLASYGSLPAAPDGQVSSFPFVELAIRCFSEPIMSASERQLLGLFSNEAPERASSPQLLDMVRKGHVLQGISVYRAGECSQLEVRSFTLRLDLASHEAVRSRSSVTTIRLHPGDRALFMPFWESYRLDAVEVLVPPEHQVAVRGWHVPATNMTENT